MTDISHNIFDYATSELSQDAFICWLVSYINKPNETELHDCAEEFICFLYNKYHSPNHLITPKDVGKIQFIKPQHHKIDVYFRIEINDKLIGFVIEDKTDTTHHSKQLGRYKEYVEKEIRDGIIHDKILIYFKTGYPLKEDRENIDEYSLFELKDIQLFLCKFTGIYHPIFQDYRNYIERQMKERSKLDNYIQNNNYELFKYYWAQYDFIWKLEKEITPLCNYGLHIDKGTSYGRPWTQLNIFKEKVTDYVDKNGVLEGEEVLFWRLDNYATGYYLAIKQYAEINKTDLNTCKRKEERLKFFQIILREITSDSPLKFEDKWDKPKMGDYECIVGLLYFKNNELSTVLSEIPQIHMEFIEKIRGSI